MLQRTVSLRRLAIVSSSACVAIAAGLLTAMAVGGQRDSSERTAAPCDLGSWMDTTGGYRGLVVGCASGPGLSRLRLLAVRSDGGAGPCLEIAGVDRRGNRGCGLAPRERVPPIQDAVTFDATAHPSPGLPVEIYGGTSASAAEVVLTYRFRGRLVRRGTAFFRVADPTLLRRTGIRSPFGYYAGTIPVSATGCRATALGAGGRELGTARCKRWEGVPRSFFIVGRT